MLALSLVLLTSAAALAGILIHDGEVGTDEAKLAYAGEGDPVKIKGTLTPFEMPEDAAWDHVQDLLHHNTYELQLSGYDAVVLITGLGDDVEPGAAVVEGDIVLNAEHPTGDGHLVVLDAELVTEPFFDW